MMGSRINTTHFVGFPPVEVVERITRGILVHAGQEVFRVEVLRADVLRLKRSRGGRLDEQPTCAAAFELPPPVDFKLKEHDDRIELSTPALVLVIDRDSFAVECRRADGSIVFRDKPYAPGSAVGYGVLNEAFVVSRACTPGDVFAGLGEKTGGLNRSGREWTLWNTDILEGGVLETSRLHALAGLSGPKDTDFDPYYVSIPFFYHLDASAEEPRCAGFFIDNGYCAHFDFTGRWNYRYQFCGGQYTEYVFAGPEMPRVLEAYTWITGRMPAPPLWSLGYHQCRWYPYTEATLMRLAGTMREKEIPCDTLWLDIDYMDDYRVFTWDRSRFPDPDAMLRNLRDDGFRTVTIIDPGVKYDPGYAVFDEAYANNFFCKTENRDVYIGKVWPGRTAFPDFTLPECREWWGRLNAAHVRSGLAGIWNDMNEPSTGGVDPFSMRFDRDGANWSHERFHNQYAMYMAMGTVDGLLQAMPDLRTFVLSRAGFAGIQRYAANWMGDNASRWEHLAMSLPMAMGLGLSGQPFVGADAGGFSENCEPELLARWMQQAALSPFFRNHNCMNQAEQYPWSFGPGVEQICREAVRLRYRLLPYIYSAFMQAAETGMPVQSPLMLTETADRNTWALADQYFFGENLLVAPICCAGCYNRAVYLPRGSWRDFHSGQMCQGCRYVTVEAPLDCLPVFVRGGSVIPMRAKAPAHTSEPQPECLDLHVTVPIEDGTTVSYLHEDDGLSFAFKNGAFYRTCFTLNKQGDRVALTAAVTGEGYEGFGRKSFRLFLYNLPADTNLRLDGRAVQMEHGSLTVPCGAHGFVLEMQVVRPLDCSHPGSALADDGPVPVPLE